MALLMMLPVFEIGVAVGGWVVVVRVGGDDVPGVQEAGEETEAGEEDVDEGVGAADAGFDPDCWVFESVLVGWGRSQGEGGPEGCWGWWGVGGYGPAKGGKMMARRARRISVEQHMALVVDVSG